MIDLQNPLLKTSPIINSVSEGRGKPIPHISVAVTLALKSKSEEHRLGFPQVGSIHQLIAENTDIFKLAAFLLVGNVLIFQSITIHVFHGERTPQQKSIRCQCQDLQGSQIFCLLQLVCAPAPSFPVLDLKPSSVSTFNCSDFVSANIQIRLLLHTRSTFSIPKPTYIEILYPLPFKINFNLKIKRNEHYIKLTINLHHHSVKLSLYKTKQKAKVLK